VFKLAYNIASRALGIRHIAAGSLFQIAEPGMSRVAELLHASICTGQIREATQT